LLRQCSRRNLLRKHGQKLLRKHGQKLLRKHGQKLLRKHGQKLLRKHGFKVSMSGRGNCYDNSAVESFFKSLKAELVWRHNWQTRREVEVALFEYINGFYNPRRKHSALGWKSPVAFEQRAA
jgi:transposase InsO family protein